MVVDDSSETDRLMKRWSWWICKDWEVIKKSISAGLNIRKINNKDSDFVHFLREKWKCKLTHSSFRDFQTGPAKTFTFSSTSEADLKWKILLMEDCFDFHFPIIHYNGLVAETDLQVKWNLVKEHYAFRKFCSTVPHLKRLDRKKLKEHVLSLKVLKSIHWPFSQGQGANAIKQWRQHYRCQDMLCYSH